MGVPHSLTVEEYRQIIEELIRLSREQNSLRPRRMHERHVVVLGGLELEVMQTAEAVLTLVDAGLAAVSAPLCRKIFEFGVVAQWLHVTGKSLEAFYNLSDGSWRKLLQEAEQANVTVPQDVLERFDIDRPEHVDEAAVLKRFEQVCRSFGANSGLYLLYRGMSSSVHPLMGGISRWMQPDPDHPYGLVFRIPEDRADAGLLYPVAVGCLWVCRALDNNLHGRPRQGDLKAIGRRLGVTSQLKPV